MDVLIQSDWSSKEHLLEKAFPLQSYKLCAGGTERGGEDIAVLSCGLPQLSVHLGHSLGAGGGQYSPSAFYIKTHIPPMQV